MTTTDAFASVLAELSGEHGRAVAEHGFDAEHDARHSDADWAWRLLRRITEVMAPETVINLTPAERRRAFVECAHIAASAVAAHDRRTSAEIERGGVLEVPRVLHDNRWGSGMADKADPPPVVTSTDAAWRYVTRPGDDTIERHTLACDGWRPAPGRDRLHLCTGECVTGTGDDDGPDDDQEPPTG